MFKILLINLLISYSTKVNGDYTAAALLDQITVDSLPGVDNIKEKITFNQFSGYLTVQNTKQMHYWFVESINKPSEDPIAFWTNGGPGCSGLLGFLTEQGPFRPNADLTLSFNPYSWNTISNMVFIESPCGVGFSYSDNSDDYHTDDKQTAQDNYLLIQAFLDRFPQYRTNKLYITSESYGGHYMPTLAKQIVDENKNGSQPILNFQGFAVGNPATTSQSTLPASVETYYGHQIISKPLWDKFDAICNKEHMNITVFEDCEYLYLAMYKDISGLNPYAIDYPVCLDSNLKYGRNQRKMLIENSLGAITNSDIVRQIKQVLKLEPVDGYEPCADDYMTSYLNQDSVKAAIHVKQSIVWADCSRSLRYKQSDGLHSMTPYYNYLIDGNYNLNILVYSGDDDTVCATIGTQSWIWDLGYQVSKTKWEAYSVNGQTAGYITKWKNTKLALATVHGAGHEVPTYKPEVALYLWSQYLNDELTNM